jgi:hypothetical protein
MYSWKDRIKDWVNNTKGRLTYWADTTGPWTRILTAVGIALVITAIILAAAMPSRGEVEANKVDIGEAQNSIGLISEALATKASQAALDTLEAELDTLDEDVTGTLEDQAGDISGLTTRMGNAEHKVSDAQDDITIMQGNITTMQDTLNKLPNSPPEGYLTGTFGDYTLHAESSEAGNFTANVHLMYSRAFSCNGTYVECQEYFYSGIDWAKATPAYATIVTYNRTAWGISQVWWNIGTFELEANTEKTIDITCVGLNSTWEPSFAYVGVWPILNEAA